MNKPIDEMSKYLCKNYSSYCSMCPDCYAEEESTALYNAGYRKQEDVAREIMDDIDKILGMLMVDYATSKRFSEADTIHYAIYYLLDELKKKYGVTEK